MQVQLSDITTVDKAHYFSDTIQEMNDTHPGAERAHINLLRQADIAKRFALLRSLSQTVIELSRRAIQKANPNLTETEVGLKFVEYHYGKDLATRVRNHLARQQA